MSYGQGVQRQYCPIQNFLNFFCRVSLKIAKNGEFWLFTKLLEILIWNIISRVPPCEASRPDALKEQICLKLLQRKRCQNQVDGYGAQFEKMQIWIEIRDSVGFMFRVGENPVEVKHIRNQTAVNCANSAFNSTCILYIYFGINAHVTHVHARTDNGM